MLNQIFRTLGLRNSKPARSRKLFTKQRHFTHERLEPRMMMTINPSGPEFLVNDTVPGFQGIEENVSSVAISETLGTIATYTGLGAGQREGIFLRRFDSSDSTQPAAERVSTTIRGTRTNAVVAANDAGLSVVVWQGRGVGDKHGLFMQRFDTTGAKVGDETLVNQTTGGKQRDAAISMAADGSFVITWSGPSSSDAAGIFMRRYNADGSARGDEELVNTTTTGLQGESDVSVNSSGAFIVTWSSLDQDGDAWAIIGQRFNAEGVRQGDEFQLNTTTAASQRESSVAMQDDGTFMAVWSSHGQDGDGWSIAGRRFSATGAGVGDDFVVNTTTTGHQRHAQLAGSQGKYLVTWQSGVVDVRGWEIVSQEFGSEGSRIGAEQTVNTLPQGQQNSSSGHQQHPAVALNSQGDGVIIWSGYGGADRHGVFGQQYKDDGSQNENNLTPNLAPIADQTVAPGSQMSVIVTATDPNSGDTLTYQLDPSNSPAGATIERTDNNTAIIRWTPTNAEQSSVVNFRILVTDNGEPPLSDAEEFKVTVTNGSLTLDLNGSDETGVDETATFFIGAGAVKLVDDDLLIVGAADNSVTQVSIQLAAAPNNSQEILAVDVLDTNITATYTVGLRRLLLTGVDTETNYERVLRTLTYNNTASNASGTRTVHIQVNDASRLSNRPDVTITLATDPIDLVAFAKSLADSGAKFYGAAWCPACTAQKELFGDGAQFLPFIEVTHPDRTQNSVGEANAINTFPTWVFDDDSRLEGDQSLATLAARAGVTIPTSTQPFLAPLADSSLLAGSPLHVSLDGYDPKGGKLTYTVTTNNTAVEATILSGNRSARVDVAGYGDMVFELFEQRATRATDRFIDLASEDFYDGVGFHRIINDFVIQGGDPTGTGSGGSDKGDFDDQFHIDLQHNRTGLLSYAKSGDDTNDSQFFVTEGSTRHLDFNHSIFGVLTEGESVRAAISDTALNGQTPQFDIDMETVEIFQDNENGVLMLKAASGTTGEVTVTVTVTDELGNHFDRQFIVTVADDTVNGNPFLGDITAPTLVKNTTAQVQLTATDVEGDAVVFRAFKVGTVNYTFNLTDSGLLTVTPPTDFVGTLEIQVQVLAPNSSIFDSQVISIVVTES